MIVCGADAYATGPSWHSRARLYAACVTTEPPCKLQNGQFAIDILKRKCCLMVAFIAPHFDVSDAKAGQVQFRDGRDGWC